MRRGHTPGDERVIVLADYQRSLRSNNNSAPPTPTPDAHGRAIMVGLGVFLVTYLACFLYAYISF